MIVFVDIWWRETHKFHLPFVEATITLEDVHFILGLPTSGHPVIHNFCNPTQDQLRVMVKDVLGVHHVGEDWISSGLKISWIVSQFARYVRLNTYLTEMQLLFHV